MRIAVLGSGGVGGYFGGRLAAAGADVTFFARGAHLAALRDSGLRLLSANGDLILPAVQATDTPDAVGHVDLVIVTVKLYDTEAALPLLTPLVGPETVVVSFQNGVEAVEMLARAVGRRHVAGGTTYIVASIAEPGVIRHTALGRLIFGPLDPSQRSALEGLRDLCTVGGIDVVLSDHVLVDIWAKFVRLTAFSGLTAVARRPIGVIRADPDLWALFSSAVEESAAVARAKGVPLPATMVDDVLKAVSTMPPDSKSSMLGDLEGGRRLELPWLSGAIVRIGTEVGVPTPTHAFIAAVLKPFQQGASI
jgi:2-dehydropantoate 2-reductase